MEFRFCSITSKSNFEETVLGSSDFFKKNKNKFYYEVNNRNSKGLSQFYNECIEKYKSTDYIVFCHDDVDIVNDDVENQIYKGMQEFDILGVAGCVNPKIIEKNLWHWMAQEKNNLFGIAGHPIDLNSKRTFYVTSFGPTPSRVAIIDGVFMAIKTQKIVETGTKFDEQFMFHHYDIDFSLTGNKNKLKIGVWPILINHMSPGLREFSQEWSDSNKKFINKWKKN
jgi:glycosyltransferase involved in cell wall biosynthesis